MSLLPESEANALPDLSVCEQEPIHIPGSIEPNGAVLVFQEPELTIVQVSANTDVLVGTEAQALLGMPLVQFFEADTVAELRQRILPENLDGKRRWLSGVRLRNSERVFDVSVHRHQGLLLIELEPTADDPAGRKAQDFFALLTDAAADLEGSFSLADLCRHLAAQIRRLTGFDRVMVYRFLEDGTGAVIAEDLRGDLPPYLGLRYPASDIPAQARRLYLLNTLRLKADVNARRVPLVPAVNPVTKQPLDMSYCVLRAMSPVHDEYLRNMGVSASMSVSIVREDLLWGLIACHHTAPKIVPQQIRMGCELLARVFPAHIAAAEEQDRRNDALAVRAYRQALEERLRANPDAGKTLLDEDERLASLLNSQGAAVCLGGQLALVGVCPPRDRVESLVEWLDANQDTYLFHTDKLSENYPVAERFSEHVAGLLSARIALGSRDFLLWFRPAAVKIIEWGGNPSKPVEETEGGRRISPRLSFERWKETVGDRSEPWRDHEREFALALRQTIAEVLLVQRNREVTHLNLELERSNIELDAFAYAASHDLQEPVRTIRSYAQLIDRRTGSRLDNQDHALLKVIETAAARMGNLISALLAFAQVGGSTRRERQQVSLEDVLRWVLMNLDESLRSSGATVTHDFLPTVNADPEQLPQLVQNLIANSIKYRNANQPPRIHVSAARNEATWYFGVHDNGEGFEPDQSEIIFGAFKRLHSRDIPGTGVGLALCKRIVEHHGGRIWAESKGKGHGATFWFTLPQS